MVKVGINGFGRIGRLTFRYAFDMPEVEVVRRSPPPSPRPAIPHGTPFAPTHPVQVHVNEMLGGAETAAYLIKYDSVHGTWPRKVDNADDHFTVDGQKITFSDKEDFTQASTRTGTRTGTDAGLSSAHAPARCQPAAHIARSKAHPAAVCARRSIGRAWVCRS